MMELVTKIDERMKAKKDVSKTKSSRTWGLNLKTRRRWLYKTWFQYFEWLHLWEYFHFTVKLEKIEREIGKITLSIVLTPKRLWIIWTRCILNIWTSGNLQGTWRIIGNILCVHVCNTLLGRGSRNFIKVFQVWTRKGPCSVVSSPTLTRKHHSPGIWPTGFIHVN